MLRHELRRRTIGDSGFRWNTKTRPSVSAGGRSSSAGGLRICGPQCGLAHTYSALSARRRCRGWFSPVGPKRIAQPGHGHAHRDPRHHSLRCVR